MGHGAQGATDGRGTWVVVWSSTQLRFGGEGCLFCDSEVVAVRSTDNGQTWSEPFLLDPQRAHIDDESDTQPSIASDRRGNWLIAWVSGGSRKKGGRKDHDILFVHSTDNGRTWSAPAEIHSYAKTDRGKDVGPAVAVGDDGTWIVTWRSSENLGGRIGTDPDIFIVTSQKIGSN